MATELMLERSAGVLSECGGACRSPDATLVEWRHLVVCCEGSTLEVAVGLFWGQCSVSPVGNPSRQPSNCQWAWQWKWNAAAGLFSMEAGHPLAHGALGSSLSPAAATILLSPQ